MNEHRILPLSIFLICLLSFFSPAHGTEGFTLSSTRPRQGSLVKITINSMECRPTIKWNDETVPLIERNDHLIGYFGVGLETKPGPKSLRLSGDCVETPPPETVDIEVRDRNFPVQRLTIEDTGKVQLSQESLRRHRRESRRINQALERRTDEKYWEAPFHPPVVREKFGPGDSFGSRRIINGHPRSPHSGEDYEADAGDPIYSIAGGRVSLTGNFFFSGNAVFLDHGHGVSSMYLHLSEIDVEESDYVKTGEKIGEAGSTGRVTGPHLHLGVQWRNARIDPDSLFFDQVELVSDSAQ